MSRLPAVKKEDVAAFQGLLDEHRYDFCSLVYIIFPFGEKGHDLEFAAPYDWQMEEWKKLSDHLNDPVTRYQTYQLIISSGNGAAKTAFGAMTILMLMYTQRLRARVTANTQPQMTSIIWPEYDLWFRRARYHNFFFEKFGQSIKARDEELSEVWRLDNVTWSEHNPAAMSGLHNKGYAVAYVFEEGPGIPAIIWKYSSGAFTETETIKIHMAFGNSDDPESKFEQNMTSPTWNSRRIDTRELKHIDPKQVENWLIDCNGNEDHDDFRVRVRGLPRKSSKDSIIDMENVEAAIARAKDFDPLSVDMLPCILTCDPAWRGGDETVIWYQQGNYQKMLERYRLDKLAGDTHMRTYNRLCYWEQKKKADAVIIDQGEGTGIYTLAMNADKSHWDIVAFNNSPTDFPDSKMSEYHNIRAQMYYQKNLWLQKGGVLDAEDPDWFDDIRKQFCWTKGARHKVTGKKLAEPKLDIKARVGQSPDVVDGAVLAHAREITERLPENERYGNSDRMTVGEGAFKMVDTDDPYSDVGGRDSDGVYD